MPVFLVKHPIMFMISKSQVNYRSSLKKIVNNNNKAPRPIKDIQDSAIEQLINSEHDTDTLQIPSVEE